MDLVNFTSGRLLARNTLINLVSEVVPFGIAIFAVPALIHDIGVNRYGVLTLSMMAVGYLGVFDFGLGRAATKFIAEAAAAGEIEEIPGLFWTSLCLMLVFGSIGGMMVAAIAPWLAHDVLKIPSELQPQSVRVLYLLAISMPFVISGGSLCGTLSAFQRFDLINWVRVPTGILSYVGPLLILPFSHAIDAMAATMALVRIVGWIATFGLCLRKIPALRHRLRPRLTALRPMLSFGGWLTVSGIVGPIMIYFDRFLIGARVSVAAVSYYTAPFQITGKLGLLPGAIGSVAFAAFSASFVRDPARAALIFDRSARYTLLALFAPVTIIVAFAPELLSLWLGSSFSAESTPVLRWLTAATFLNCLAWIPYCLLQAAHRPDVTAKLHLAEIPFYLVTLWWMLPRYGIEGAAIAYTLRIAIDTMCLFVAVRQLAPRMVFVVNRTAILATTALALAGATVAAPSDLSSRCVFVSAILIAFTAGVWTRLLEREEKTIIRNWTNPIRVFLVGDL